MVYFSPDVSSLSSYRSKKTSCVACSGATTLCPRHVQVVTLWRGRQAAARSGRWHINCWRRYKLSGDLNSQPKRHSELHLLTLKVVSESRVTWATSVPIVVFLGLSVLDLGLMYATDRQTDRQTSSLNASTLWGGGITKYRLGTVACS